MPRHQHAYPYPYIYTYIYIYIPICVHTRTYIQIPTYISVYIYRYRYIHMHTYGRTQTRNINLDLNTDLDRCRDIGMHIYIHIYTPITYKYIYIPICVHTRTYIYRYLHIYPYIHTDIGVGTGKIDFFNLFFNTQFELQRVARALVKSSTAPDFVFAMGFERKCISKTPLFSLEGAIEGQKGPRPPTPTKGTHRSAPMEGRAGVGCWVAQTLFISSLADRRQPMTHELRREPVCACVWMD